MDTRKYFSEEFEPMIELLRGRIDRNLYFLMSRYGWIDLLFRKVDLSFLPGLIEKHEVDKWEKYHFTESSFRYHVAMVFFGMKMSKLEEASRDDEMFRKACKDNDPISRTQLSRDLADPDYVLLLRDALHRLRDRIGSNKDFGDVVLFDPTNVIKKGKTYEGTGKVYNPKTGRKENGKGIPVLSSETGIPITIEVTGGYSDADKLESTLNYMINNVKKPKRISGDSKCCRKKTLNMLKDERILYHFTFNHTIKAENEELEKELEENPLATVLNVIADPTAEIIRDEKSVDIEDLNHKPRMLTILKDPGKGFLKENTYQIITSDKRSGKNTVLGYHRKKWNLELKFGDMKMYLSLKDFRVRKENAIEGFILAVFITFMLIQLYLQNTRDMSIHAVKEEIMFPVDLLNAVMKDTWQCVERLAYLHFSYGLQMGFGGWGSAGYRDGMLQLLPN